MQELADRIASIFVPAVILLSIITGVARLIGGDAALGLRFGITTLVVACPCALGLATPIAMAAGLNAAAKRGILVRDQSALDALARSTDLVLDKPNLTTGNATVQSIIHSPQQTEQAWTDEDVCSLAAALESGSEHPLAQAFSGFRTRIMTNFEAIPGQVLQGTLMGSAGCWASQGGLGRLPNYRLLERQLSLVWIDQRALMR